MFSKFFTFSLSTFFALVFMGAVSICLAQGTWATKKDMPSTRDGHSTGVVNDKIYVIGGIPSGRTCGSPAFNKVEVYDPSTDTWDTTKTDMPTAREVFTISVVNDKIYAIGGQPRRCSIALTTVEVYDPITDTWSDTLAPMPTRRAGLSSGVVYEKIYVIGGQDSFTGPYLPLTTVEEYDPSTDTWETKADMPTARAYFSTIVFDEKIYVFPDYWLSGAGTIDIYDPLTDTWQTENIPDQIGGSCSASTVDDAIYTFGGSLFVLSDVWQYKPGSDSWSSMSPMPTGRVSAPATEVNGKIYIIGGSITIWLYTPASTVEEYTPPIVGVEDPSSVPVEFLLYQSFPNPFNPSTLIKYQIPELSFVTLKVYDVLGSEIITLVNEEKPVGTYEITWYADNLPSGIYFYRLQAGSFVETKKMILLR